VLGIVRLEFFVDLIGVSVGAKEWTMNDLPIIINLLSLVLVDSLSEGMLGSHHHRLLGDITNTGTFDLIHIGFTEGEVDFGSTLLGCVLPIKYSPDVVQ